MEKYLHIVSLDSPEPPNYGGAIDMFYKIISLSNAGIKIILHYFKYNDRKLNELEKYCTVIYAYARKGFESFSFSVPYIINSRINEEIIENLKKDKYPILLEGIHCTGLLPYIEKSRFIVVRVHNNEAVYYNRLAKSEKNFFKKVYFKWEGYLLQRFQKNLPDNINYACLSLHDLNSFKNGYRLQKVIFMPCFIAWDNLNILTGFGNYCLYHGNMSVSENEEAALWLIDNVFKKSNKPFVIAGKDISKRLKNKADKVGIKLFNNPSEKTLDDLISNAHINIIHSVNRTGVKLKLIHALFKGRHCLTNFAGFEGSGLNSGFSVANSSKEYINLVNDLYIEPFSSEKIKHREYILEIYNNNINAQKLIELLY